MAQQYGLNFTSNRDELLALIAGLREIPIGLSRGRVDGVVELLQRLVLLCKDSRGDLIKVEAQVSAIGARITARKTVKERTVRNWRADAVALGILSVDYTSAEYGGHSWNRYTIDRQRLAAIVRQQITIAELIDGLAATRKTAARPAGNGDAAAEPRSTAAEAGVAGSAIPETRSTAEVGDIRAADVEAPGENIRGFIHAGGPQNCSVLGRQRAETGGNGCRPGAATVAALGAATVSALTNDKSNDQTLAPIRKSEPAAAVVSDRSANVGAIKFSDLETWRAEANRIARLIPTAKPRDRDLVAKVAAMAVSGDLDADSLENALEAIQANQPPPDRRAAYLIACLKNQGNAKGYDFRRMLAGTSPPI